MKIVSMGGGTGLSTLLKGLKTYIREDWKTDLLEIVLEKAAGESSPTVTDLTAVVTVSDDGGSSGRLRREFQVLPPGDIRNCMVALSEDEALLSRLFQFRFASGAGLKGHSFGNLFLTALTGITGDFQEAVKVSGEVLAIRGNIFPSTITNVSLEAVLDDGRVVKGETKISRSLQKIKRIRLAPARCRPMPQTLEAISQADAITLGPGSLYTSLIPNLLVKGVPEALRKSGAAKIYICNLMTQPGETTHFSAADHLRAIYDHCGQPLFDYVLVNSAPISASMRRRYQAQKSQPVAVNRTELEKMGVQVVAGDFVAEKRSGPSSGRWVRHHPERLATAVLYIAASHRYWGSSTDQTVP
ncbi:MAG: YvcK family protein [Acidobacteria bacterium]|nr:YvcK family protein [Acidobacteriota bacterium]